MSAANDPSGYYEALGVSNTAPPEEIKNKYRSLAKKLHPDLNPGDKKAEAKFKKLAEAYDTLSDLKKRAKYDRGEPEGQGAGMGGAPGGDYGFGGRRSGGPFYRETQGGPQGGRYSRSFSFEDLFGAGASAGFGGDSAEGPAYGDMNLDGEDAIYRMDVDFKDAALGAEKEINLPNGKRLAVKIPAGIDTGAKLRFPGHGNPPVGRGRNGDAYVEIRVRVSPVFKRSGNDVEIELPISLSEAILGAEIPVPTLEGNVSLRIPAGVSTGSKLRIRGKGIPGRGSDPRGDEIVRLTVVLPKTVDPEFRDAVEKWSKAHPYNPREEKSHVA
jgi:DnaJ-class molecular chaperone